MYNHFIDTKDYSTALQECIENTVEHLTNSSTNFNNPGMLLGKIQSGKTRTFIGIIALAFDRGYDICVIFTKGTRALASQTLNRLDSEFYHFIENDEVKVYDIMSLPPLTPYIKQQKLIFIVKKETNNLDHLVNLFVNNNDLSQKRVLFIDDEADFASVGFKRDKNAQDGISMNDLVIRNGIWVSQPDKRDKHDKSMRGWKKLMKEQPKTAPKHIESIIKNTYRTLMTRGMKGCIVYSTDKETREWLKENVG